MTPDELKLAAEFHRGYEAGKAARTADEWQLDRERAEVVRGLRDYDPCVGARPTDEASKLIRCITGNDDSHAACVNDLEEARDRLVHLLGGGHGATDSKQPSLVTYDVLGNERHKAVCELRKMHLDTGSAIKKLAIALGVKWNSDNAERSVALLQKRLIHLLGGDQPTLEVTDGCMTLKSDGHEFRFTKDDAYVDGVPVTEALLATLRRDNDECNFSAPESDMDAEDAEPNPAKTPDDPSDHVSFGTQPIASEQREYADDYCYRGNFEAFKSTAYPMPWDNPAETSEDASDHVAQGTGCAEDPETTETVENRQKPTEKGTIDTPIASITDELRKFAEGYRYIWYDPKTGAEYCTTMDFAPTIDSVNGADYINAIADRIDERYDELQAELDRWKDIANTNVEALLRINAKNTDLRIVAKHERDELQAKYDRLRKRYRKLKHRVLHGMQEPDSAESIMQDYIIGTVTQEEAVARIKALRDA